MSTTCEEEIVPTFNDVVTGRGNGPQQHPGNQRFRAIVERHRQTYATLKKTAEKQAIANQVWKEIQSLDPPGRFLKQNKTDKKWSVEEDSKVISKIKQALREKRQEILERQESEKLAQTTSEEDGNLWDLDKVCFCGDDRHICRDLWSFDSTLADIVLFRLIRHSEWKSTLLWLRVL